MKVTKYHEEPCHMCGTSCSMHPDAANPLASCGDCGGVTCLDHRVDDSAQRCNACAAIFYAAPSPDALRAHIDAALTVPSFYWLVRLSGRCATGAERDRGFRIHVVPTAGPHLSPTWGTALCGARPGRLSGSGFVDVDGAESPTCPRCIAASRRPRPVR